MFLPLAARAPPRPEAAEFAHRPGAGNPEVGRLRTRARLQRSRAHLHPRGRHALVPGSRSLTRMFGKKSPTTHIFSII